MIGQQALVVESLPDIPRALTGVAEWVACLLYLLVNRRRLARARLVAVAAGGLVVLVGVQLAAGELPLSLWTPGMLASVACMFGLIRLTSRVTLRAAAYLTARALVLAELVAALHWQLHCFLFLPADGLPSEVPRPWQAAFLVAVYAAAFVLAAVLESRHFRPDQPLDVSPRELASTAAMALVTFFMSNISFLSANTPFSGRLGTEIFYIRTLVDLCGFVALYAQQSHRLQLQAQAEVRAVDGILRSQHEQYLQSKRNIEAVRRTYHDLKHQIGVIRSETDPGRKASYLDELEESIQGYSTASETGNGVLDVILTTKWSQCAERGIDLTVVADGAALRFMTVMDICTVFGNALDNAIEATSQIPDREQRLIKVAVFAQNSFVVMTFENSFDGQLRMEDGAIVTRRADRERHGYGLKSIRWTAEKYGGSMTVHADDRWFALRVLLPVPQEGEASDAGQPSLALPGSTP